MQQIESFEQWCLVEMMGRNRIAGKVTERVVAGQGFLQVDVPETKKNPAFTRLIHPNSLYAINPMDEQTARAYAENIQSKPIDGWDVKAFLKKAEEHRLELQAGNNQYVTSPEGGDDEEDEEDEHYNN
jgi:hypothetical protein